MNYISFIENPQDTSYYLFVTNTIKEVLVKIDPDTTRNLELRVNIFPKNTKEYLIENNIVKIPEVTIYFKEGIPTEAHAKVKVRKLPYFEAHGYLIKRQ